MSKPKFPTTLFKDGDNRDDTVIVEDAEAVKAAAKDGYFPFGGGPKAAKKGEKAEKAD